jgi:outer membrane protein, heavy metal efflux system
MDRKTEEKELTQRAPRIQRAQRKRGNSMRVKTKFRTMMIASLVVVAGSVRAQEMQMTKPEQHHQMESAAVKTEYPRMGRAQENAKGRLLTLEEVQKIADDSNPTLRQAEAEIRAAKARQQQAGLYPNPTVAYTGDEIRGGLVGGGKQGFFVQQRVVTGGKLRLSREVYGRDVKLAEIEGEEQKIRVQTAVKMAFLRVLGAQELLEARRDMAKIVQDATETQRRLMNTGQADESEVLEAEVEAQRMRMGARMQENTLREEWRSLAAVIGRPEMALATIAGDLEKDWPELNEEDAVNAIAKESPAVRIADAAEGRAQGAFERAKRDTIPDVQVRGGMEYNNETLGSAPFAKGWEGIAEVAVQIPLFNRNQGNVTAARADIDRATQEKNRIALTLRVRAAAAVDQYANARLMAVEYREEMLPRAKKAYGLMVDKYGQMLAAYPRVLEAKRKLYELQIEYIAALENVWNNGIALQGFLLTDGLEAPARPSEVDRPVRETNVPMQERTISPRDILRNP